MMLVGAEPTVLAPFTAATVGGWHFPGHSTGVMPILSTFYPKAELSS